MERNMGNEDYRKLHKFCRGLPKVELHAHLNGSLSAATLRELTALLGERGDEVNLQRYVCEDGKDWRRLAESFKIAHTLTSTAEAVTLATQRTIEDFARDGCEYVELRSAPRPMPTRDHYVEAVLRGMRQAPGAGESVGSAYIVSLDRSWSPDVVSEVADLAVVYNRRYPELVVGMDLSGDPSAGRFQDFAPALQRARQAGLKISVHCGEVPNPSEVLDILNFRPDRIGHAVHLYPDPNLQAQLHALTQPASPCTAVEVCMTSNVVTGSVKSYSDHHVKQLQDNGVPFILCTDDCGVFNTTLSHEYAIFAKTFGANETELYRMTLQAWDYSFSPRAKHFFPGNDPKIVSVK